MTRVLCLTSWFPPHHFGGYELSCHDVMARLAARGHHVEVLTSDHRHDGVTEDTPPVATVHRRLRLYFRRGELWSPSPATRLRVERHNQRALAEVLATARPDVVSVWHVGAMSLGLLTSLVRRGIPLVYAVSDDWPTYAGNLDAWTRMFGRRPLLRRLTSRLTGVPTAPPDLDTSGAFCFISEVTRDRCRDRSPWAFPRSTVVYSGIDHPLFASADRREPDGFGWRLLYVGRIDPRKGIRTLLRALALLPEATLVIDGHATPADRARVDAWADEAGVADRVRVQSSPRAALPDVYAGADVCVFPSEWEEPFGLVPLEAMACGTAVVASGVGGSAEFLVDRGNCLLFTAGEPASLAAAVRTLAEEPALRRTLVRGGRPTARFFDVAHLADTFERWHDAAARGYPAGPPAPRERPRLPQEEVHGD